MTASLPIPLDKSKITSETPVSSTQPRKNIHRRCLWQIAGSVSLLGAFTAFFVYHEVSANSLMAKIHHDFILCTRFETFAFQQGNADNGSIANSNKAPAMVKFNISAPDSSLDPVTEKNQLDTAIAWARRYRDSLMMLQVSSHEKIASIIKTLSANRLLNRVVISADNMETAKTVFNTNANAVVAVPVKTFQDLQNYRSLARHYTLAFYIPNNASVNLFQMAHKEATAIITDVPNRANNASKLPAARFDSNFLATRKINILVTDPDITLPEAVLKG
ncbi:hypothetical protein [Entomobacter blattae]|uniref:Uncharacterized protein n=1 Tax=Entomobacter blattae TaxID=2762277 RepID=A0A7H1NTG6_9PROT|nr:hypothetical protein [Entomobacter blattae]QNT79076.1 hypothetical protein JGUZn3_18620 [Entomobacter blattae]